MQTRGIVATCTAALLSSGGPVLLAQQTGREQLPAFRSGIEVVTIEVGVVDKQGQPLRGLGPADFVVTVGGQTRRVVTAEFVDVSVAQPDAASRPAVVPVSTNEGGGVGRLFVFIVDQNTLEPGNARHVATAASRFFKRLTFADRSALLLMPVGPNIGFTWAHDRVREGLQRVTGLGRPIAGWDFGSLTEARDIASRNLVALRSVGERECGRSIFASGGGGSSTGSTSGGAPVTGGGSTPAPGGGGAPSGGEAGGSGTPPTSGGGSTGGGGRSPRGSGTGGGFGMDPCMRDVEMQAEAAWREAESTSLSSLTSLRQMLTALGHVRGDKTVILISGGWPLDLHEETSVLQTVAAEAAAARATFFTLFVPGTMFSADRRRMSSTPSSDHYLHSGPLETLASMTGGGSFRAEVNAESAFERLGRELSGYYRIGVEKDPGDVDGKTRRMKVHVPGNGLTVRAREFFDVRTYEDRDWTARLASAIDAPVPATGVGLRVTSYLAADPDDGTRLKLVVVGEASRLQPGEATFRLAVRDLDGKTVLAGDQPLGDTTGDALPFSTSLAVAPGSYIVRIAVMDGAGRVGSVDHRIEARRVPIGTLSATGPLLVRVPSGPDAETRFALDNVRQDERLALEVDFEGDKSSDASPDVVFEIAATAEGPALVQAAAALSPGSREGSLVAQAVADMRVLPPGDYVARAKIKSRNEPVGEMRRAFAVIEGPRPRGLSEATSEPTTIVGRMAPAKHAARAPFVTVPAFALDQVLAPQVLGAFLDRVAARPDAAAPGMRELIERARTTGLRDLVVSDALAAQTPVAAFLSGLSLLAQKNFVAAAKAFRSAMRASADFYPAMVYLGACYAAGGNDKEAAGAWRTALIREGDTIALHQLLADALLRQGKDDLALQTLESARARWPEDDLLKRRFVVAALLAGKRADGLQAVDELIARRAADEPSLAFGLLMLYEAFVNGRPVEGVEQDRARMMRFADAYRVHGGPSLDLVNVWVAAATKR